MKELVGLWSMGISSGWHTSWNAEASILVFVLSQNKTVSIIWGQFISQLSWGNHLLLLYYTRPDRCIYCFVAATLAVRTYLQPSTFSFLSFSLLFRSCRTVRDRYIPTELLGKIDHISGLFSFSWLNLFISTDSDIYSRAYIQLFSPSFIFLKNSVGKLTELLAI